MDRLTDPGYIPERVVANMSNAQLANIYKKLCIYESTELKPNQINEMMAHNTALIEQLADLTDAEEQGLLLRLPCKVGDIVYQLNRSGNITPKKVLRIECIILKSGFTIQVWFETAGTCCDFDFGKTVFLNKSDAIRESEKHFNRVST